MHSVVMESLEEYLAGTLTPAAHREFEAHLNTCEGCRREVQGMQEIGALFSTLASPAAPEPRPGFYAGVLRQVEAQARPGGFANLFALDLAFGRRLAFASLMTLAILGSYLVSRETNYTAGPSPESVMASDQRPTDRNLMLVTLTSYEP